MLLQCIGMQDAVLETTDIHRKHMDLDALVSEIRNSFFYAEKNWTFKRDTLDQSQVQKPVINECKAL